MNIAICNNKRNNGVEILNWLGNYGKLHNVYIFVDVFKTGREMIENIKSGERYDLILIYCDCNNNGCECGPYLRKEMNNQDVELVYVLSSGYVPMEVANSKPLLLIENPLDRSDIERIIKLYNNTRRNTQLKYVCKNSKGTTFILCNDIMYVYSNVRVLTIVTNNKSYTCYDRIKNFPDIPGFYQINKSYIINANYLAAYSRGKVVMNGGKEIYISRYFKDRVREELEQYVADNNICVSRKYYLRSDKN